MTTTHIVCGLTDGGDDYVSAARVDLTPAVAERLLNYRGLIAAAQQVDEERFFGVEFLDAEVVFGVGHGVLLTGDRWERIPAEPAPGQTAVPDFTPADEADTDAHMVVVTVDGPFWSAEDSSTGTLLETPILPWDAVEAAARGEAVLPVAPYDTHAPADDEEGDDDTETWLPLSSIDVDIPETPLGGPPAEYSDTQVTDERDEF